MILWFLRLFPTFVRLEVEKLQAVHLAEMHARRADAAEQQLALHQHVADENAARVDDLKRMVDSMSFQVTRRNVFARNEAPPMPEASPQPVTGRRFARDIVHQREREFREEIAQLQQEVEVDIRTAQEQQRAAG